jgi:hypothetical protein
MQALVPIMRDPVGSGITDASGNPTPNAYSVIQKAAPTTGAAHYSDILNAATNGVKLKGAWSQLTNDTQNNISARIAAVVADKDSQPADVLDMLHKVDEENSGKPQEALVNQLTQSARNVVQMASQKGGMAAVRQVANSLSRGGIGNAGITGPGGVSTPQNAIIQAGGSQQPGAVAPALQGGGFQGSGPPIANTLPPQIIQQPITGAPAQVGGGAGTTPRPIGGNPWQPYAGQGADIQSFQNEVQQTRADAQQAPLAHNINQQILRLADNAKTGPGTEIWQHAVGALGAPLGLSPSANYQELGKFLEKNAINNMQSMGGPPSDARLSAAAAANGSTTFSPEALKAVTKFNDATTSALMQYRQGLDHAVGMGQNVNYTNLPAYKAAWAKNFDVNIFRVENAMRDGDTQELHKIAKELGPDGLKALAQKRQNLQALSNGQAPQ